MKIVLIGNYSFDNQQSMQRLSNILFQGLLEAGHDVRCITAPLCFGKLRPSRFGLGKWLGYIDKFVLFPWQIPKAIHQADVVHICDHSNAMYISWLGHTPHVVTCCDLLSVRSMLGEFWQNQLSWTGKWLQKWIVRSLDQAQHICCISQATVQDALRLIHVDASRVSLIYLGLNYPYAPMPQSSIATQLGRLKIHAEMMPFFLHVGGTQWYKNLAGLIQIFRHLKQFPTLAKAHLIMVGKPWSSSAWASYIHEQGLSDCVWAFSNLSNEDLQVLYNAALALIFPSWQEGFGWPILEAMASGCPVFTTNRMPMTEIGGDAAVYFDPNNPIAAATIIHQNLGNLKAMAQKGLIQATKFSTAEMVQHYIQLYERLSSSFR